MRVYLHVQAWIIINLWRFVFGPKERFCSAAVESVALLAAAADGRFKMAWRSVGRSVSWHFWYKLLISYFKLKVDYHMLETLGPSRHGREMSSGITNIGEKRESFKFGFAELETRYE